MRLFVLTILLLLSACGPDAPGPLADPSLTLEELIDRGASLLWVGAHPDDETVGGPILARACRCMGNPCHLVILTSGEGGHCYAPPCLPDLPTVRLCEMEEAARIYGTTFEMHGFTNHPSPAPEPQEVLAHWMEEGDPVATVVEAIRAFRPDVVLSFDPSGGYTAHNEHMAAAEVAIEATIVASDPSYPGSSAPPQRPKRLYTVLNRYWFMGVIGWDEGPVDETIPIHVPCPRTELTCFEAAMEAAYSHRSQWPFMAAMGLAGPLVENGLLKRMDF